MLTVFKPYVLQAMTCFFSSVGVCTSVMCDFWRPLRHI